MRRLTLLLLLLAAPACLKPGEPIAAAAPAEVALAAVRTDFETPSETGPVHGAPARLERALVAELASRNLSPEVVPEAELIELFGRNRASAWRLEQLATHASGSQVVVLVEGQSTFYAQMAGRYRWKVQVVITLAAPGDLEGAVVRELEVPVFLQYHHQRADDALAEATPTIERRLGEVLDEYLSR